MVEESADCTELLADKFYWMLPKFQSDERKKSLYPFVSCIILYRYLNHVLGWLSLLFQS